MSKRHEKLGIKQTIQLHWMDHSVQLLLSGMPEQKIRRELDDFLSTQKQSGGAGERGQKTYGMAISILAAWFAPDDDLRSFRDEALDMAQQSPVRQWLPLHWAVLSASYPFWFNVAMQTGRLFNLQSQITQAQIFGRLREKYGDREAVSRNARYAVRSFVAWGALQDTKAKGCYEKGVTTKIDNEQIAILMLEAALLAMPDARGGLGLLSNNPAFFPFHLPVMTGDFVSQHSKRIDVVRYDLDNDLLKLKG